MLAVVGLAVPVAGAAPAQSSGKCPLNALKNAKSKPVEITYWQGGSQQANEEALGRLTDKFNSSQNDVRVTVVNQTTYADTLNKFRAGLSSGDLPDLVQIEDTGLQQMIDTQAVLPAQACVNADKYDLSDHLKRVVDYYSVKGKLWPMPFNVSNPVFYYNKKAFQAAGLDPNNPPKTLDEVKAAAQKLKDSGAVAQAGFGLKLDSMVPRAVVGARRQDVREQRQRAQEPRDEHDVRQRNGQGDLHVPERDGESGPGADQPRMKALEQYRQPDRHRERQLRHDDRHVRRARHDSATSGRRRISQRRARGRRRCRARRGRAACSSAEAPTTS